LTAAETNGSALATVFDGTEPSAAGAADAYASSATISFPAGVKLTSLAAVVAAAKQKHDETRKRWLSDRVIRCRITVAWSINALIYIASALLTLTYGVKYGSNTTNEMLTLWMLAILQIYLIIEPVQIILIVCLPSLCDKRTRVGRFFTNARACLRELCDP